MKRTMAVLIACLSLVIGFAGVSYGKSSYATSFKSTYPSSPLSSLSTVSGQAGNLCTVCHGTSGTPLNAYGDAYKNSGHVFGTIESQDSDGDSFNNRAEIDAGTFPGNASSKPAPAGDTTAPVVTGFTIPATASSLTVSITTLTATDAVGVTGYLVNESSTKPSATAAGWSASKPASYTFASAGAKTLYAWAKDAAGNVSNSLSAGVTITLPPAGDTTAPVVTGFTIPATASSLTVSITTLTATDAVGVTGYLVNESSTKPSATAAGWSASKPASYTFASAGAKTLYAWAKDAAGNVSNSLRANLTITTAGPAPTTSLIGVFRKGQWHMDLDGNDAWDQGVDSEYAFGKPGDKPVVGDWDGSGITKIGVFRGGKWLLDLNGNGIWEPGIDVKYDFGGPGVKPVVGDWDGSGVTKVGAFRDGDGKWLLDLNGNGIWEYGIDVVYAFGKPGDKPVVGDWDGSGVAKIGVFRNGKWLLDLNGNGTWEKGVDVKYAFGSPGDRPVVGDWDGSGVTRVGIVSAGVWYLDMNGDGLWDPAVDASLTFGPKGTPVTGAW